jgi:hypothetical protein
MYDDDDEATQFELSPLGSRQRLRPPSTFRAVATTPTASTPLVARLAPPFPAAPIAVAVVREADIATVRVPRLPPAPRSPLLRLRVPVAGILISAVFAIVIARPDRDISLAASAVSAQLAGETTADPFHVVTSVEDPPAPLAVVVVPRKHASGTKRTARRPTLAVDTSTPLGDLARHRR